MKKSLTVLLGAALFCAAPPPASASDFSLDVHIGNRQPSPIIVSEPPLFLESVTLGLQVAVGSPHDMFFLDGRYFLFRDNGWLVAPSYGGPWTVIHHDHLPPGLSKRDCRKIFALRDAEYERYRQGRYRGKTFRPGKHDRDHKHKHGKGHKGHGNGKHK